MVIKLLYTTMYAIHITMLGCYFPAVFIVNYNLQKCRKRRASIMSTYILNVSIIRKYIKHLLPCMLQQPTMTMQQEQGGALLLVVCRTQSSSVLMNFSAVRRDSAGPPFSAPRPVHPPCRPRITSDFLQPPWSGLLHRY